MFRKLGGVDLINLAAVEIGDEEVFADDDRAYRQHHRAGDEEVPVHQRGDGVADIVACADRLRDPGQQRVGTGDEEVGRIAAVGRRITGDDADPGVHTDRFQHCRRYQRSEYNAGVRGQVGVYADEGHNSDDPLHGSAQDHLSHRGGDEARFFRESDRHHHYQHDAGRTYRGIGLPRKFLQGIHEKGLYISTRKYINVKIR